MIIKLMKVSYLKLRLKYENGYTAWALNQDW